MKLSKTDITLWISEFRNKTSEYYINLSIAITSLILDWAVVFCVGQVIYNSEFKTYPNYASLLILSVKISYENVFISLSLLWILALALNNCYGVSHSRILLFNPLKMLRPTLIYFFCLGFASFILKAEFSRSIFLEWMLLGTFSLILTRSFIKVTIIKALISKRRVLSKLIVIGTNKKDIEKYTEWIFQNKKFGFKTVSRLECTELNYYWITKFDSALESNKATQVLLLPGMERDKYFSKFVNYLQDLAIQIHWIPLDSGNFGYWDLPIPQDGLPFLTFKNPKLTILQNALKRLFDISFSILVLVILFPIFFFLAILILIRDGWPIFYVQKRVGKDGKVFKFFKFRTMVTNAENLIPTTANSLRGKHILFKNTNDPRVTRLGKFLRKYSLDELPQFLNVLNGSMSVVGPRPALPREVSQYDSLYERRLIAKPGITGPWQVGGRSDLDLQTSVALDLNYLVNWSFSGDLFLIVKTIQTVVNGRGAY